jgi:hypothetical protein
MSRHEEDIDAKRRERQSRNVRVVPNEGGKANDAPAADSGRSELQMSRHEEDIDAKRSERQSRNIRAPPMAEEAGFREALQPATTADVVSNRSDITLNNSDLVTQSVDDGTMQAPTQQSSSSGTEKERVSKLPPSGNGQQQVYVGALSVNTESNTAVLRPNRSLPMQPKKGSAQKFIPYQEEDVEKGPPEVFAQPAAQPADEDQEDKEEEEGLSRRCWLIIAVILVVVIGGAAGGVLAAGGSSATVPPETEPPRSERFIEAQSILSDVSAAETFQDSTSSQYKALSWLADNDMNTSIEDTEELQSRYILAVFYYSLDGPSWIETENAWLSAADKCAWNGVTCNEDSGVESIIQDTYANFAGIVPDELQSLTTLGKYSFLVSSNLPTDRFRSSHYFSL